MKQTKNKREQQEKALKIGIPSAQTMPLEIFSSKGYGIEPLGEGECRDANEDKNLSKAFARDSATIR